MKPRPPRVACRWAWLLPLCLMLWALPLAAQQATGAGDTAPAAGSGADATPDRGPDREPDRGPDAGLESGPDAGPETGPESRPESGPESGPAAAPQPAPDSTAERDGAPRAGRDTGAPETGDAETRAPDTRDAETGDAEARATDRPDADTPDAEARATDPRATDPRDADPRTTDTPDADPRDTDAQQPGARAAEAPLQAVLQGVADAVARPSRRTVGAVIDALLDAELEATPGFLRAWSDRAVVQRPGDGRFFLAGDGPDRSVILRDLDTGAQVATVTSRDVTQIRPNAGVRAEIAAALIRFELSAPDPARRIAATEAIARSPDPAQIPLLRAAVDDEPDPAIRARMKRLLVLLGARFATGPDRIAAIEALAGDVGTEARGVLNQILQARAEQAAALPDGANIARVLEVGRDLSAEAAQDRLAAAGLVEPRPGRNAIRDALRAHLEDGAVGGIPVHRLTTDAARRDAYRALQEAGRVPPLPTEAGMRAAVDAHVFYERYLEPDAAVTDAARAALDSTRTRVGLFQALNLGLEALSLASIFFLGAIGLAITFGVMRVINMAHGEFIMMGAYTGYVVQTLIPGHTLSLAVALPLAFAVTFAAGVALERLVIRHLYARPLETLLATFGISIALQQLAKNIFGPQARPLTAPDWLAGAIRINDIAAISTIRVGIFVMAVLFLLLLLHILNRTRLGLEVRAVTQNPGMAASMGIDPDRINMLTFGLGSGIAGTAGVAIGLFAQVTSEMGANYIVQSFMTVVVGGVGSVFGTLAGAGLIGFLQKGIEWFNPANTLAAQTWMVLFIILFIQVRPRGIVALKGRAAGD